MGERVNAYFYDEEFADAKSAYLADWRADHEHGVFPAWVHAAIARHAARSPQERAALARERVIHSTRGQMRNWTVVDGTHDLVSAARRDDEHADRFLAESTWIAEAIHVAVQQSVQRHGQLPPAPARLPNRLA
ncbi:MULTISPECIES: hypothetical protein [Dermacoccus]|uniref:Uncharacterized protein n=2 Tax=Dermacoccus TaxID=57495 RepID=A0A417Z0S0_9MICO|nr:hypothetical protein [Dermacoccus abyssi]RHW44013.1 hypothetical protein D1832_13735 [Dermacoccus abyssi]